MTGPEHVLEAERFLYRAEAKGSDSTHEGRLLRYAQVHASLAIRDELVAIRELLEQRGICPHGNSGVCMYCVQPTLDAIEMAVRAAVKR